MKTIIAGSRSITDINIINKAIEESGFASSITEIVSGEARGVDKLGEQWANENNIPIKGFPAKWKKYGRSAGVIRNNQMAKYADALVAVWDGVSTGTQDMINRAKAMSLTGYVFRADTNSGKPLECQVRILDI